MEHIIGSSANIELYSSDYDPGNLTGVTPKCI